MKTDWQEIGNVCVLFIQTAFYLFDTRRRHADAVADIPSSRISSRNRVIASLTRPGIGHGLDSNELDLHLVLVYDLPSHSSATPHRPTRWTTGHIIMIRGRPHDDIYDENGREINHIYRLPTLCQFFVFAQIDLCSYAAGVASRIRGYHCVFGASGRRQRRQKSSRTTRPGHAD